MSTIDQAGTGAGTGFSSPRRTNRMKYTTGDLIFTIIIYTILVLMTLAALYPVLHVLFASVSDPVRLMSYNGIMLRPIGFTLEGYRLVFVDQRILTGYTNTMIYVGLGTLINMVITIMGAYTLSRRNLMFKRPLMIMVTITMFFSGGLIPWFLVVRGLGMYNNLAAMVIPTALNTWNMILLRIGFQQVPLDLEEAAEIDGASQFYILTRIITPLSKATMAVILLYYLVGNWNSWFNPMILLQDREKFPLQLFLREILLLNDAAAGTQAGSTQTGVSTSIGTTAYRELVKYCTIVVATAPIMLIYPFLQKYFMKGVFVGSLKG